MFVYSNMMGTILQLYKNEGETPLECLERLRIEQPQYKDAVLSYAGRLDPMAEGILLVLVDEENKKREQYLGFDKEYEVEILFGVSTDTGDILGMVDPGEVHVKNSSGVLSTSSPSGETPAVLKGSQKNFLYAPPLDLTSFVGPFIQKYPAYSSKPVNGKPLFQWAREGKLEEIEIPEREAEIYSIERIGEYEILREEMLEKVRERIGKVKGDFRQKEILASWNNAGDSLCKMVPILQIKVTCSSGTYMRSLAESLGKKLGIPSLAWKIKRSLLFPAK